MPPSPKYKSVRQAVACGLLGPRTRNKVVTCSQFAEAFNARVRLGSGMGLSDVILKKSFAAIGEDSIYHIACRDMGIGHTGDCVLFVMKSFQLSHGSPRMTAFGIFDSVEIGEELATKENVLDDSSIGRLQIVLTDEVKIELIKCLTYHFPLQSIIEKEKVSTPEPRRVSVSTQELEEPPPPVNDSREDEE